MIEKMDGRRRYIGGEKDWGVLQKEMEVAFSFHHDTSVVRKIRTNER